MIFILGHIFLLCNLILNNVGSGGVQLNIHAFNICPAVSTAKYTSKIFGRISSDMLKGDEGGGGGRKEQERGERTSKID